MTLRWGFIGAGAIASRALAPAVHAHPGSVLAVVGARDVDRAAALGPMRASSSYLDVVEDPGVDVVYVSLPPALHREWVVAALDAGKHVLCEKPLGCSAEDVVAMQAAAEAARRLLVEALMWMWQPRLDALLERVELIAPVRHVAAGFGFAGVAPGDFRLQSSMGGGALLDLGCYPLSAVHRVLGDRTLDAEVTASALQLGEVELEVRAVLDLPDVTAEVGVSMQRGLGQWLVVTGERGELEMRPDPYAGVTGGELLHSDGKTTHRLTFGDLDRYLAMVDGVAAAIGGDVTRLAVTPGQTLAVAILADRIRASWDS